MTELDNLYAEYQAVCRDRGVFAHGRADLMNNDPADWLRYAITLVSALPTTAERQSTIQQTDYGDDAGA